MRALYEQLYMITSIFGFGCCPRMNLQKLAQELIRNEGTEVKRCAVLCKDYGSISEVLND